MRHFFALLFFFLMFFMLVPVTAHAASSDIFSVESVGDNAEELQALQLDEFPNEPCFFIRMPLLPGNKLVPSGIGYAGLLPPLLWRPPMTA